MTDAPLTFDRHAAGYDEPRRRLIPPFDRFYGTAVELVPDDARLVLDLGAGTGLLSRQVARARPQARLVLLDGAPAMLDQAVGALGDRVREAVVADLLDPWPEGPYDAVVSALAVHHLDDAGKAEVARRAHAALRPGGVFVPAEQVAGPTPAVEARYLRWRRNASFALGTTQAEWDASLERQRHDRHVPVAPQLAWLREASFEDVDCPFHDHRFAVLTGRRP